MRKYFLSKSHIYDLNQEYIGCWTKWKAGNVYTFECSGQTLKIKVFKGPYLIELEHADNKHNYTWWWSFLYSLDEITQVVSGVFRTGFVTDVPFEDTTKAVINSIKQPVTYTQGYLSILENCIEIAVEV